VFDKNMNVTMKLLRKHLCLLRDFQALVDSECGPYHIDLDRCYELNDPGVNGSLPEQQQKAVIENSGGE